MLLALLFPAAWAGGEDHFLVIGGGYAPESNQISLEKNIHFFRRMLEQTGHAGAPQHYLFGDGADPGHDVQYSTGNLPEHRLGYLLATVFEKTDDVYNAYRSNDLTGLAGPATPAEIDRYFDQTGCHIPAGDRLLVYYTGHGGRGETDNAINTTIELWDRQKLRMKEFIARLDKVPQPVPVVLVMVQCYSGGFANVIFNEGDPAKGLSDANRAGFFATVHDRQAAGCTPDINEANYQEYSSHFFAALAGSDRLGRAIARPDHDGDGRVSFDEAHAYALLVSDSIDVSIKTTDVLLRQYSRTAATDEDRASGVELLSEDVHYPALLAAAGPCEKAVLEGLSAQLKITDSMRTAAARHKAGELAERRTDLGQEAERLREGYKEACRSIAKALKARWPELQNPWHPRVARIITTEHDALLSVITGHPKFSKIERYGRRLNALENQRLSLERQWAKCQRLIRTAENVALAENLPKVAPPQIVERYRALAAAEHASLD